MPKRAKEAWNEFDLLRALVIMAIVIYILGIVPQFTKGVKALFANPLMKIVFLSLIVFVGYLDSTIGTLLAVAFLVSYLATPEYKSSPLGDVVGDIRTGAGRFVGGVGTGASQLVGGVGTGATELVRGVGGATGELIGGLQTGSQRLTTGLGTGTQRLLGGARHVVGGAAEGVKQLASGLGAGSQQLIGGAGEVVGGAVGGVYQVIGGVGRGAQRLVGGAEAGTAGLIRGVQTGAQSAIRGAQTGTQQVVSSEGMQNAPLSVSQAYQEHAARESDGNWNVSPPMATGCDPIVGYNAPYNCGCSGKCGGNCKGLDPECLCKGVQVWQDEMNAQGLNHPRGYAGGQVGSTY